MKKLEKLIGKYESHLRLCAKTRKDISNRIVDLLKPVIPTLAVSFATAGATRFVADWQYLRYSKERRISLTDVLHDFVPIIKIVGDVWISDDEMYEVRRILEETL